MKNVALNIFYMLNSPKLRLNLALFWISFLFVQSRRKAKLSAEAT